MSAVLFVPRLISRPGGIRAESATTQVPTGAVSAAAQSPSQTSSSPAVALDGCSTADRVGVDCRATHRYEALPAGSPCTMAAAMHYLGGRWLLDVPMTVRTMAWPGGRCVIDAGRDVHGSARGVMREPAADWRRCADTRRKIVVRCSQRHTSEFIGTGSTRRASPQQCATAARIYINKPPASYADKLSIAVLPGGLCLVSARGNHLLTTTIRNLGVWPVPLTV